MIWCGKYLYVRLVLGIWQASLMVFRRWYCAGKLLVELEIFFSLRSHPDGKHSGFHLSLVLSSTSPEEKTKIEPCRSLQLCGWSLVSAGPSSPLSKSFWIYCLEMAFLWTMPLILPDFLRSFTKASKILFVSVKAASAMIENSLHRGGERRYLSMAARIDFREDDL